MGLQLQDSGGETIAEISGWLWQRSMLDTAFEDGKMTEKQQRIYLELEENKVYDRSIWPSLAELLEPDTIERESFDRFTEEVLRQIIEKQDKRRDTFAQWKSDATGQDATHPIV